MMLFILGLYSYCDSFVLVSIITDTRLPFALMATAMTSANSVPSAKLLKRRPILRSMTSCSPSCEARNAPTDGKDILEHRSGWPRIQAV